VAIILKERPGGFTPGRNDLQCKLKRGKTKFFHHHISPPSTSSKIF
jgi:hypothetical protein